MLFVPKPCVVSYKTSRSKTEVVKSLETIGSFSGDRFRFPVRIFGNKLFVRRKYIIGDGEVLEDNNHTLINVTLKPSGEIKFVFAFTNLICLATFSAALIFVISGNLDFLFFIGLVAMSLFWPVIPRIVYSIALEMRKSSIESLVLRGN